MDSRRLKDGKLLRRGKTTGACAAEAAGVAAETLLTKGLEAAEHSVVKDAGDDPDTTHGCTVRARVKRAETGVAVTGGEGIGRVTKAGLDQPVGEYAINTAPRRMIAEACAKAAKIHGYGGGFTVEISIPGGEELSKRTFNPRLGIEGGLSVLGTTGVVEPMSEAALADTIRAGLKVLYESGHRDVLFTIGNYGQGFAAEALKLDMKNHVKCSNFIGEALAAAAETGFKNALLVGHIGKLIKLGIGVTNTHSRHGDGRAEIFVTLALDAGARLETLREIRGCVTADAALECLRQNNLLGEAMRLLSVRINENLIRLVGDNLMVKVICFCGNNANMTEVFRI